ncbi:helix-turn-helix domain-containing protein [Parvimonas sp. G1641]|uniref:helix-turn-helix domain-containing protein n=1 Tax=Parvimonas sp. G1641 TaxID=3388846 RepID=UPI00397FD318
MSGKITLKAARVNAGLTQKELVERIGKSETTIVKWENDQTGKKISIEKIKNKKESLIAPLFLYLFINFE